ncbi:MAG: restriction endonuclease subunit S [Gammaproteobacteria bacterium]|nr:restriction endonuclease subunit S [Gammaproteobacteria bacterium]
MGKNANTDGMLPKGWQKVRLHEVASVKTGPFGTQLHQHDYVQSDGTPIITVEHLSEKGLRHKNLPLVSDNDKQRLSQYLIHEGDIVFSRVGSVDRSALVKKDEDGWLFSGRLLRLRPRKDDVHSPYLNYFFHTKKFRHHMRSIAVGGIMPSINTNLLSNVFVQLPPLPEQKAIASLLEIWDTAIEKTETLITVKQKRFEWLLKTLIANNCSEWKHYKSMDLFESLSRRGYVDEQLLSATQAQGVVPRSTLEGRVMSPSGSIEGYKLVEPGNFTISLRSFQGGIEYSDHRGVISPAYTVLTPIREMADDFYKYFFKSHIFIEKYLSLAVVGIRDGKQINFDDFKTIKIPYPPLNHQVEIANTLNVARQEIDILKLLTDRYHTQKRGLMQELLTGKLKVNT